MNYCVLSMLVLAAATISGCAGSPTHTASLSPDELAAVNDETLCQAATPREHYRPTPLIIKEVKLRGIDCATTYTYTPAYQGTTSSSAAPTRTTTHCTGHGNTLNCTTRERY